MAFLQTQLFFPIINAVSACPDSIFYVRWDMKKELCEVAGSILPFGTKKLSTAAMNLLTDIYFEWKDSRGFSLRLLIL